MKIKILDGYNYTGQTIETDNMSIAIMQHENKLFEQASHDAFEETDDDYWKSYDSYANALRASRTQIFEDMLEKQVYEIVEREESAIEEDKYGIITYIRQGEEPWFCQRSEFEEFFDELPGDMDDLDQLEAFRTHLDGAF